MASDFATNPTTTSTFDDVSYASILTDEVLDALMAAVVTPALLDFYDLSGEASKAIKIPKADKFTAAAVNEGTELTNTALTTTSVTGTAAEIGIQATITDVLEVSDIPAAHASRLRQLGRALADKMDVDICALLAGFDTDVGSTGVNIALADLLEVIYTLEVADASNLGPIVAVLHPRQTADLRDALDAETGTVYGGAGFKMTMNELAKGNAGYFGSWFGIDIYQSTNVPTANGAADRAGGAFIKDYALAMVQKWAAKIEPMRWAPIRGWVLVATSMYGVFEVEDAAGVEITTDA